MKNWYNTLCILYFLFLIYSIIYAIDYKYIFWNAPDIENTFIPRYYEHYFIDWYKDFYFSSTIPLQLFAIIVASLSIKIKPKSSYVIILSSLLMTIWSCIVLQSGKRISLSEVILFWLIYIIVILTISYSNRKDMKYISKKDHPDILDHELN